MGKGRGRLGVGLRLLEVCSCETNEGEEDGKDTQRSHLEDNSELCDCNL